MRAELDYRLYRNGMIRAHGIEGGDDDVCHAGGPQAHSSGLVAWLTRAWWRCQGRVGYGSTEGLGRGGGEGRGEGGRGVKNG